ncbi:MAG: putative lipoprotein with Yx(FWY)xxD motif/cytochrome c553 [Sulfurimonas sp.]|jgi:predicted lipoprotein with Yx(FWY)xxD motif/cytochrome c553|uniref:c-type cytochrome n=1 Tax=Sulfurimonas sp. TaxID=2022749 RepID=UPI0039E2B296
MKKILNLAVASVTSFLIVGCSDTYDSGTDGYKPATTKTIGSLQREVSYLTDVASGLSLYTFDKDTLNVSNCDAACREIWPIFTGGNTQSTDIEVFDTTSSHLAFRQHPMYFFINDAVSGDVKGDNVKDIWHLLYAPIDTNDAQTQFSSAQENMIQTYLTDDTGRALYTYDNDTNSTSNCYGMCEDIWPVYYAETLSGVPSGMNISDFTTISRDESKSKPGVLEQTAYKGKPLYYFTPDNETSGETKGDWVKGVWHLVEVSAQKVSASVPTPSFPSIYTAEAASKGKVIFTDPAKCSSCHGADGQTPPLGVDNVIAKYGDAVLIDQKLKDMRDNGNPNNRHAAMVGVSSGLSDEAIINLSAFVATLKK